MNSRDHPRESPTTTGIGKRLAALAGIVPQPIALLDARGVIVHVNAAFCSLHGDSEDALRGTPIASLYADAGSAQREFNPERHTRLRCRHHHKDGRVLELQLALDYPDDSEAQALCLLVVRHASTSFTGDDARKREDLRAFEVAFDFSPDALALSVAAPDFDVRVHRVNHAFCELTGYSEQELNGRTATELKLWDDDGLRRAVVAHLRAGEVINDMEATLRRKNGELVPTAFSARRVTIDGQTAFLAIRRDIRERAKTLERLRESEERWRFALESDGGAVWDWDLVARTVYRSRRLLALLGNPYAPHECSDTEVLALIEPSDRASFNGEIRRLFKGKADEAQGECTIRHSDGAPILARYVARAMRVNTAGRVERIVGTLYDITRLKQRERKLQIQQEQLAHRGRLLLLGEMASITAHEINQPLTAIASYAGLCASQLEDRPVEQDLVSRIEQQALRAGQIVWRMHDFARHGSLKREPLNIAALAADIVKWLGYDKPGDVRIEIAVADDLPDAVADRVQIEQVLINLIRNGVQAMEGVEHAKRVTIEAQSSTASDHVVIHVSDRGPGVPEQIAMDVFKPFFTTSSTGLGLGLAICNSIVTAHGGRLWCGPRPGGGSVFSFNLPTSLTSGHEAFDAP